MTANVPPGSPTGSREPERAPTRFVDASAGRQWMAIGLVVVVAVLTTLAVPSTDPGTGSAEARVSSGTRTARAAAAPKQQVERTPAKSAGTNPFTASVAVEPTGTSASTVPGATVTPAQVASSGLTTQEGSTPGLYGGTRNIASCDAEQLVSFLAGNPDKARAWASVIGIATTDIPAYIRGLTPVLLRADTAVTNHWFENGVATPIPAVLQAGTAVLVDQFGVPRVRCYCGNPLLPPVFGTPSYTGPSWSGFDPRGIVTVAPALTPITVIRIVDVTTGRPFDRPVGSTGTSDTDAKPAPSTTTTVPVGRGPADDPNGV